MLDYVLTFHGQARDSIELHHKARFTAHVAGVAGELRWGANGRLGEVETVRPDDLGVDPVPEDFVGPVPEAEVAVADRAVATEVAWAAARSAMDDHGADLRLRAEELAAPVPEVSVLKKVRKPRGKKA